MMCEPKVEFNLLEDRGNYTLEILWWRNPIKVPLMNKGEAIMRVHDFVFKEMAKVNKLMSAMVKFEEEYPE